MLVANAAHGGFRIVDAFSRIVRLGEGVAATGALSEAAMDRTVDALKVCAQKMMKRGATRRRCIATQACRSAGNGAAFLARVRDETGIDFEIITPEEEARLAVAGCADLVDPQADAAIVFDIGGGSTEISFLARRETDARGGGGAALDLVAWLSIPFGVVTLSEKYGGAALSRDAYAAVISDMKEEIRRLDPPADVAAVFQDGRGHLLGTSGTVTSLAGVHLGLPKYRRDLIDGLWLTAVDARSVSERLRAMSLEGRAGEPCIGGDRADLVVCGCAIFEAILDLWPCERIRVADRGLREGVLAGLIEEDRRRAAKRRRAKTRARRRAAKRKEAGEPDRDKNGDA
ncbi:MAG: Ppx/GppA family phosphatase [Alphaproteobacteria bacterium]|nr:Ppx/GppA family phosphatase [Alphaproteobacteria bacterium]